MKEKLIVGNWKMNLLRNEAFEFSRDLLNILKKEPKQTKVLIVPSFVYLSDFYSFFKSDYPPLILLGAQNCSAEKKGSFTGEVSANMLAEFNVSYCLVGHSERRTYFLENPKMLEKKIQSCLTAHIKVIFCIGETLLERESGQMQAVLEAQIMESLKNIGPLSSLAQNILIAYEPVWAIGTGKIPTTLEIQEVIVFVRNVVEKISDKKTAADMSILYGGSCTADNVAEIALHCPNIDGFLVGGASLRIQDFYEIIQESEKVWFG